MKNLNLLNNVYAGQSCNIIGKGPSLDYLTVGSLVSGPVIAINEAIHKINALCPENDVYALWQDTDLRIQYRPAVPLTHIDCRVPEAYVFDPLELGFIQAKPLTLAVAIAIVLDMGCDSINLISFDALVNNTLGYAKSINAKGNRDQPDDRFYLQKVTIEPMLADVAHDYTTPIGLG